MSGLERINSLKQRKKQLDNHIHEEEKRPCPDDNVLAKLKSEKLHINDEISVLSEAG